MVPVLAGSQSVANTLQACCAELLAHSMLAELLASCTAMQADVVHICALIIQVKTLSRCHAVMLSKQ